MKLPRRTSDLARYGTALAYAAGAVLARMALEPWLGNRNPYFVVYPAVLICTRTAGVGPGALVLLAGTAGTAAMTGDRDWVRIIGLVILGVVTIWVVEALRRAHASAEESARIAEESLQKLREESAHRAREESTSAQLRAVVESSGDAIISKDLDGIIQSWNLGAEQIFGYTADEAVGKPIGILMPAGRTHEESDIMERIRHGTLVKHFETVRRRKDGNEIHVSLTISPVLDAAQKVVGASHIARDITERKALEEKLRQSQKLESLGVLAGGLAHDFNNLLTGIMGNASLVIEDLAQGDPAAARMEEILHASERAAVLVRQMLAYAGKGRFVIGRVNLATEVAEVLPLVRTSISRLVDLDLRLDSNVPAVEADRSQIQQLIVNLAQNAAEAIGEQAGEIGIRVCGRETDLEQQVLLEVRDTGCGMDAETQARAFDPFFTTKFTGRGLGLSAVMGIIRTHRGSISVESTPGKGSAFTVVLPAMAAQDQPISAESGPDLHGNGKILIVDDEELVRGMARFTLERCGYTIELAVNGKSGVEAFAARPQDFAAVLLDLTMPVMSGEEALEKIRQIRPDVPVLLSSGYSEMEAVKRFQDHGVSGFLQKPYTATALARKVKHILSRASAQSA